VIQRILLLLFFAALIVFSMLPQDMPHGDTFELDCELCHATDSWEVNPASVKFDHNTTGFPLLGIHKKTECRPCHENLVWIAIRIYTRASWEFVVTIATHRFPGKTEGKCLISILTPIFL
jgi:hypothetical protein